MRPSPRARRALVACPALVVMTSCVAVAGAATTQSDPDAGRPTASVAAPSTHRERLNVRVGQTAVLTGKAVAGRTVVLERRAGTRWRPLDHDRVGATGRYDLRYGTTRAASSRVRVRVTGSSSSSTRRLNVYRRAFASWYGPGLYGNRLACGGTLTASVVGVAHRSLPCGTRVTLRKGDRIVRARVVDRGPFAGDREFDLTPATKEALGFGSTGSVEVAV